MPSRFLKLGVSGLQIFADLSDRSMAKSLLAPKPISLTAKQSLCKPKQTCKSVKFKEHLVYGLAAGAVPALAEFTKNFSVVC